MLNSSGQDIEIYSIAGCIEANTGSLDSQTSRDIDTECHGTRLDAGSINTGQTIHGTVRGIIDGFSPPEKTHACQTFARSRRLSDLPHTNGKVSKQIEDPAQLFRSCVV